MTPRIRYLLIGIAILVVLLVAFGLAYRTSLKAKTGPQGEPVPEAGTTEIPMASKIGRFNLGEFVATSRDEDLHYIKIEVEVGYVGTLDKELEERKGEMRDAVTTILMKLTTQRAKEDYIDHFLHKDIENKLNQVLGRTTSESRIIKVFIPVFLIN